MLGLIIKDDDRYDFTKQFLYEKGILTDEDIADKKYDFILFPFKHEVDREKFDDIFFSKLEKDILIFNGIENDYLKSQCKKNGLYYLPLMNSDYVATLNAIPTAEGVIAYAIQNTKQTIANSSVLIIGYGRCGKVLASKFYALGANVYTNTLEENNYGIALSNKIIPSYNLNDLDYDIIINTAPCETISNEMINKFIDSKTLLIDITKFGFNINLAKQKNIHSERILSIPSKFSVQTAGEILGEYIYKKVIECYPEKK